MTNNYNGYIELKMSIIWIIESKVYLNVIVDGLGNENWKTKYFGVQYVELFKLENEMYLKYNNEYFVLK